MPAVAPKDKQRRFPGTGRPRRFEHLEARQMFEPGALTLDERISATWTGLVARGTAECPVCSSPMRAAQPCASCGSELS
jgi:hypothetical protein